MSKELVQEVLNSYFQEIGNGAGKMIRAWTPAEFELAEYANQLEDKLAAAEKIFFHFGGLAELKNWENGQGETAVDLIDDYLKL